MFNTLEGVREQTYNMCVSAITRDGLQIQFVRSGQPGIMEHMAELRMIAVKQNGRALCFIRQNQTLELCVEAVLSNGTNMLFVNTELQNDVSNAVNIILLNPL